MATIQESAATAAVYARAPRPRRWAGSARRNAERMAFADAPRLIAQHCRERAADFAALLERDPLQAKAHRAGMRVWLARSRSAYASECVRRDTGREAEGARR